MMTKPHSHYSPTQFITLKMNPISFHELRDKFNLGEFFKFLHFWGHQAPADGSITKSCFSQWYEAPFEAEGIIYRTAEHFMMASKARLFNDQAALEKILKSANPGAAKACGREIAGFVEDIWERQRFNVVVQANLLKFSQHPSLCEFLLRTGTKILVEASPTDRIWGIGLSASDPNADNPNHWKGSNLLGFALMSVREKLQKQAASR
jgi:ribA/ribD-fused uncharacterized protein